MIEAARRKDLQIRNPLLVVVDMQIGFLNENSLPVVPSVLRLLDQCDQRGLPVIFTKFVNRSSSAFELLLAWTALRETAEIDLHAAFRGRSDPLVEKYNYTVFTDEFDHLYQKYNYETLLICGVSTESCIFKTALDAFERGLRPIVVVDACASDHGTHIHLQALELIKISIGAKQIMSIEELMRDLDH